MASDRKAHDLGSLIVGVCREKNWQWRLGLHQVFLFWDEVVGAEIAAHAQPEVIKRDVLWLRVSDSVWMQQLQFEKMPVLEKINDRLAGFETGKFADNGTKPLKISDLRFAVSRTALAAEKGLEERAPAAPAVVDADRLAEFDQLIAGVSDPQVKESMRRLWLITEKRK
ncbi:MAG: DUF721 domain-containing protein [Deltaproteobacteria bacterium]|nr:DUF721 domain-containing protein [Deltaproteobacteria bacterium]